MALFAHRPQQIENWAGLPGEPLNPRSDAEQLAESILGADAAALLPGESTTTVSVPVSLSAVEAGDADGD